MPLGISDYSTSNDVEKKEPRGYTSLPGWLNRHQRNICSSPFRPSTPYQADRSHSFDLGPHPAPRRKHRRRRPRRCRQMQLQHPVEGACRVDASENSQASLPAFSPLIPLQPTDSPDVMRSVKYFQRALFIPTVTDHIPAKSTHSPQRHALERVTVDMTFEHLRLISQPQPTPRNPSKSKLSRLTPKISRSYSFLQRPRFTHKKTHFYRVNAARGAQPI
jgi:hypothetical protein